MESVTKVQTTLILVHGQRDQKLIMGSNGKKVISSNVFATESKIH